jgi:CoA-transferase family III
VELDGRYDAGMPTGTAALAVALAELAAGLASSLTGVEHRVDAAAVLGHLLLPLVTGETPAPAPPRHAPGGGAVHADILGDDEALFAALAAEQPAPAAERLAGAAQACRLPVTPYRSVPPAWSPPAVPATVGRTLRAADVTVIDMTAMWAGPLCTRLLADWGASVVTVEPATRPDGVRRSPAQFAVLDRGKWRVPWDLARRADRDAFESAIAGADVLVESFSARVLPNLGYAPEALHRINPRLTVVAIRAFPATSPDASWVAFGRGVHAASGLGVVGGEPVPSLLAYPDPLAGLVAFCAVLAALGGPGGTAEEVSLAGAISPLLPTAGRPLGTVDSGAIASLGPPGPMLRPAR